MNRSLLLALGRCEVVKGKLQILAQISCLFAIYFCRIKVRCFCFNFISIRYQTTLYPKRVERVHGSTTENNADRENGILNEECASST